MTSFISFAPGFSGVYFEGIDALPLHYQYRLLHDLPGGQYVAPEVKRRMWHDGVSASQALAALPPERQPQGGNALPRHLWNKPSLIDFNYWATVNAGLRKRGVQLPCDVDFGVDNIPTSSVGSGGTATQGSTSGEEVSGTGSKRQSLQLLEARPVTNGEDDDVETLRLAHQEDPTRLQVPTGLQLLRSYAKMALAIVGRCLNGEV